MYEYGLFTKLAIIIVSISTIASGSPLGRSPSIDIELDNTHLDQLVQNGTNEMEVESDLSSSKNLSQVIPNALIQHQRLRQDESGLENVAEIVTGVLGGGLGNIFSGSTNFIGNQNVQEEATFVLNNIAPVFDTVFKYGWQGLKQYFGMGVSTTTPRPIVVYVTQPPQLVPVYQQGNQTYPIVYPNNLLLQQPLNPQPVQVLATTTSANEDDDDGKAI